MSETGARYENDGKGKAQIECGTSPTQDRVDALYRVHRDDIYRFLLTRRLEPAIAQELAQDTFVHLFVSLSKGAVIESERAWLYRVALRTAIDYWRHEKHSPSIALEDAPGFITNLEWNGSTPETVVIEKQRTERVAVVLAHLPEAQRAAIHLRMQGMRYRAIAKVLDVSLSTVSELIAGAVERLRSAANG